MKKNIGLTDKSIRITIASTLVIGYMFLNITGTLAVLLFIAVTILLLTSFSSFCPLYALFGMNSCKKNNQ